MNSNLSPLRIGPIELDVPVVKVLEPRELPQELENLARDPLAAVQLNFRGPFSGSAALAFPPDSAAKLVAILVGEEPEGADLDAIRVGTLTEVGNIVINGVMGKLVKEEGLGSDTDH